VAVPLLKLKACCMHPETSQKIGGEVALRFPLSSAVAVIVGQVMIIGGPDTGVSVKLQLRVSVAPG